MSDDFLDQDAVQEISNKLVEATEALGMTVTGQQIHVDPETGDAYIVTAALLRSTAYRQVTQDLETRRELQRMAATEAQTRLDDHVEKIKRAVAEGRILDVLMGEDTLVHCAHENVHEGLCLDCQEEVTSDS